MTDLPLPALQYQSKVLYQILIHSRLLAHQGIHPFYSHHRLTGLFSPSPWPHPRCTLTHDITIRCIEESNVNRWRRTNRTIFWCNATYNTAVADQKRRKAFDRLNRETLLQSGTNWFLIPRLHGRTWSTLPLNTSGISMRTKSGRQNSSVLYIRSAMRTDNNHYEQVEEI